MIANQRFIVWEPVADGELNGKLESEARETWCGFARVISEHNNVPMTKAAFNRIWSVDKQELRTDKNKAFNCIASRCAHWRWLHRGGMTHEKQTFQSEWPMPEGAKAPADVPEGWTFMQWDYNTNKQTPKPRFWASRPTALVILPRGYCGIAGEI